MFQRQATLYEVHSAIQQWQAIAYASCKMPASIDESTLSLPPQGRNYCWEQVEQIVFPYTCPYSQASVLQNPCVGVQLLTFENTLLKFQECYSVVVGVQYPPPPCGSWGKIPTFDGNRTSCGSGKGAVCMQEDTSSASKT